MKKDKKEGQKSFVQKTKLTEENIESAISPYSEPDEKGDKLQSNDPNRHLELSNRIKSASSGNDKTQETNPKKKSKTGASRSPKSKKSTKKSSKKRK